MGEILTFSQSSLLLLPKIQLQHCKQGWNPSAHYRVLPMAASSVHSIATKSILSPTQSIQKKQFWWITASVISDSKMLTTFIADSAGGGVDVLPDTAGAGDDFGNPGSGGNGGGGGNDGGDGNNKNDSEGESDESNDENLGSGKKTGMSMSQKMTLGYAILVGAGGLMGFLKSGSQKSLISGGMIALILFDIYTLLPRSPATASAMGLGTSLGLLIRMGTRFKASGKIFPAVVSIVSLFMSGGYLQGILGVL